MTSQTLMEQEKETLKSLKHLEGNKSFIGREFLNWLWFYIETHNNIITIPKIGLIKLFIEDRILLVSASGSVREQCLKGTAPAYSEEAHIGLMSGKSLAECKFLLTIGSKSWNWMLKAEDLSLCSIKLPTYQSEQSNDPIAHRIDSLDTLVILHEFLYESFMTFRLSNKNLVREMNLMKEWTKNRQNGHITDYSFDN